jgi:translation initiation factor IF-3
VIENNVLVIDHNGLNLGAMSYSQAKVLSDQLGLDLVEVSKKGETRVLRIMDKGKWEFEKRKKEKKDRHHNSAQTIKEIKFRPVIESHDQQTKVKQIEKFLEKGYGVKILVYLKGREKSSPENADIKLQEILSSFEGRIRIDNVSKSKSNNGCSVIVYPNKH